MTRVRCYNLSTGHIETIHEWEEPVEPSRVEEFVNYCWQQDHSADHYYEACSEATTK